MAQITMRQQFDAPVSKVFQLLGKHATYNTLLWPIQTVRVQDAEDAANPDGVGSVRKMGLGFLKPLTEQITHVEDNQLIEYRVVDNPLFSYHLGRLVFEEVGGKALLTYSIKLESRLPVLASASLWQTKLLMTRGLKKLARHIND